MGRRPGAGDAAFDAYLLREYGQVADVLAWEGPGSCGSNRRVRARPGTPRCIEAGLTAYEWVRHLNEVILPELVASCED